MRRQASVPPLDFAPMLGLVTLLIPLVMLGAWLPPLAVAQATLPAL